MDDTLYQKITLTTLGRQSRDETTNYVLSHPNIFGDLLELSFQTKDKHHPKACMVMQLVLEKESKWLLPYLDFFCKNINSIKDEGALRSVAKICMILSELYEKTPDLLTDHQSKNIIELAFDKIINPKTKVASMVHFIRTLYYFGKNHHWIHDELKAILLKDYENSSAAFKAAARDILKRLKTK